MFHSRSILLAKRHCCIKNMAHSLAALPMFHSMSSQEVFYFPLSSGYLIECRSNFDSSHHSTRWHLVERKACRQNSRHGIVYRN